MNKIKYIILSLALVLGVGGAVIVPAASVGAQTSSPSKDIGDGVTAIGGGENTSKEFNRQVKTIVNTLLFLLGIVAVIVIILGGFRYATSNGDANGMKAAKDMILYAVIGLIVAILAYAIVNFVVGTFASKT
jgi:multisubunit Na+/H+ antiporter MnhB subunit